jgi:hypothetical protein
MHGPLNVKLMSSCACNEVPAQYSTHSIVLSLTSYFHYAVTCV